jgi:penicillin-binding protein 1A
LIRLLKFFWWSIVAVVCGLLLGLSGAFLYLAPNLPSVDALRNIQLQIPLRVFSSDGKLIAEFGDAPFSDPFRRYSAQFHTRPVVGRRRQL